MRKAWKHLFALAAAFVVAVATLGVRALAEDPTYTITIQNAEAGHTYEAYQIFAGTYSGGVLSDITWGNGVANTATIQTKYSVDSAANLAEKLTAKDDTMLAARDFAAYLTSTEGLLSADNVKSFIWNAADKTYTASGLPAGYYLVKDQDNSLDTSTGTSYTDFIMQVVGNVAVEAKGSAPTVTKTVVSGKTYPKYLDTAIGSTVTFKLEATLPTKYDSFSNYKLSFVDTHSAGLTYSADTASITAKLVHSGADTPIDASAYTTAYSDTDRQLTISFSDLKTSVHDAVAGDHIIVTYNMTLNENAVIGGNGNPNTVKLNYSNNPTKKDSTGSTPEDEAIVFTYGVRIAKVDQDSKALTGATFTLESKGTDGTYTTVGDATVSGNLHAWKGLAPGTYRLTETAAPAQYNKLTTPMEFTITADHKTNTDGSVDHIVGASDVSIDGTTTHFVSVTDDTGTYLGLTVQNKKGSTLPSTGGMGTTLFYGIGGLLVVAGGALFIAKKNAGKIN